MPFPARDPAFPWNHHARPAFPSCLFTLQQLERSENIPISCWLLTEHFRATGDVQGMENLRNCHPLGKEQGRLSLLDTSQGLSLDEQRDPNTFCAALEIWKYHQSQLRAEIIPSKIIKGQIIPLCWGTKLEGQRWGFLLEQKFVLFDFCLERP